MIHATFLTSTRLFQHPHFAALTFGVVLGTSRAWPKLCSYICNILCMAHEELLYTVWGAILNESIDSTLEC